MSAFLFNTTFPDKRPAAFAALIALDAVIIGKQDVCARCEAVPTVGGMED